MVNNSILESLIERFESSFGNGDEPKIERYLDEYSGDSVALCRELIHTELELRLKGGQNARVEEYLARFPDLQADPDSVQELVATEYRIRSQFETGLRLSEYVLRFPDTYESLLDLTESELADISRVSKEQAQPSSSPSNSDRSNRFRKTKLRAQGGLGNVWAAHDQELDRPVALKEIRDKYGSDDEHQRRFVDEAVITAQLEHPGIVPIYGMGKFRNGRPYYAMRMIDGKSLSAVVEEYHQAPKRNAETSIQFRRLLRSFLSLCQVIDFAHQRKVIHRDIKPGNTMIGRHGETYVVDWGMAKDVSVDPDNSASNLTLDPVDKGGAATTADQVLGSPAFMSPEQAAGETQRVSIRSDVYSLGATLLSIITGVKNPNSTLVNRNGRDRKSSFLQPEFKQKIGRPLRPLVSICEKAMKFDPDQRYASAMELAGEIEKFLASESVTAHRESIWEAASRFTRRNRLLVNLAMVATGVVAVISIISTVLIARSLDQANLDRADANAARTVAELERIQAQQILEDTRKGFNVFSDLFSGPGECGLSEDMPLSEGLAKLRTHYYDEMPPRLKAMVHGVFARNHHGAMRLKQAHQEYDAAISLGGEHFGIQSPFTVEMKASKAVLHQQTGELDHARKIATSLLPVCEGNPSAHRHNLYVLHSVLAPVERMEGHLESAMKHAELAYEHALEAFGDPKHPHCIQLQTLKIGVLRAMGQLDDAQELCEQALKKAADAESLRSRHGIRLLTEVARIELARATHDPDSSDDVNKVIEPLNQALELQTELLGASHLNTRLIEMDIANSLGVHPRSRLTQLEQSEQMLKELFEQFKNDFPRHSVRRQIPLLIRRVRTRLREARRDEREQTQ